MYSDKIQDIKYRSKDGRISFGELEDYSREKIRKIVSEFCTADDMHCAEQSKLFDLFDEYCTENDYPLFNHKTLGRIFKEVFSLDSKTVRINGEVKRIYVKKARKEL